MPRNKLKFSGQSSSKLEMEIAEVQEKDNIGLDKAFEKVMGSTHKEFAEAQLLESSRLLLLDKDEVKSKIEAYRTKKAADDAAAAAAAAKAAAAKNDKNAV